MITVTTSLDRIIAHCGDRPVVEHESLWGNSGLATDPNHVTAAAVLREQFRTRPAAGAHLAIDAEVEIADLSAHDTRFETGEVA